MCLLMTLKKMLHCWKFRSESGVPIHIGSSDSHREFWLTSGVLTNVGSPDMTSDRPDNYSDLTFGIRSELFQIHGKLGE